MTFYQPDSYDHTIFVIGTCIARGFGVSDRMTIPSILQEKLIKTVINILSVIWEQAAD